MNIYKSFLLLISFLILNTSAYALSKQDKKWADDVVVAGGADDFSDWYEIGNYNCVDFAVLSSAGSGLMTVQYASDKPKQSIVDDSTVAAFSAGTTQKLWGCGVSSFFVRLKVTCSVGPCTYDGWFTAKGEMP